MDIYKPLSTSFSSVPAGYIINLIPISACTLDKNWECPICLEQQFSQNIVKISDCNHKFHINCIKTWITTHNNEQCPLCRTFVTKTPDLYNPIISSNQKQ